MDKERAELVERLMKWSRFGYGIEASACMVDSADAIEADAQTIAALRAEVERLRNLAAEEFSSCMDNAVSKAPDPLLQLGKYLSALLDEDQWPAAERYLNAAVLAVEAKQALKDTSHDA